MNIGRAASKNIAFTIAAAQSTSIPLDVAANVQTHLRFVEAAAQQGVQWLVFPELSLTGYELAAMTVLIANHGGPSGGCMSAGKSGIWEKSGICIASASGVGDWLVIASLAEEETS